MQKLKRLIINSTLLSVLLVFGASVPAYAFRGSDDQPSTGTQTAEATETEQTQKTEHPELRKRAEAELAALRAKHQETKSKNSEERHKKCEAHKQGLTTKFSRISTNSQRMQDRIDSIFAKAQAYQQANNLPVDNYDSLVATATAAQAASKTSIETLKSLTPTIDCNNTSTASDVAAFKTAAADTRDKLKAYRSAVKDLIKALKAAKPTEAAEGSNQ